MCHTGAGSYVRAEAAEHPRCTLRHGEHRATSTARRSLPLCVSVLPTACVTKSFPQGMIATSRQSLSRATRRLRAWELQECLLAESAFTLERIGASGGFESELLSDPFSLSDPLDWEK